jgi:fibronectin type 3 domain-containing protein
MKRPLILFFIGLLCTGSAAVAQRGKQPASQIKMIARPDSSGHSIRLRWAATSAALWKLTNQYGFILERYTVLRDKKMLDNPERKVLGSGSGPIKSKPLNDWEVTAKKDQYAAVLAQALYGKDFQVGGGDSKGISRIISQSQETEQRFSFSLFAADMSFDASLLAGWAWVDNDVRPNEKYLYRLTTAVPANLAKPDTTGVFVGAENYEPLPAVQEINAQFGNQVVMLTWDYSRVSAYYTSYFVEKSEDNGKTFRRLSDVPVSNLNENEKHPSKRMYLTDTLRSNNTTYQYRVRGINPFGETGPPSEVIKGQGANFLPFVPGIESAYVDDNGVLQMQWAFDEKANALIKGFRVNRADDAAGPYTVWVDSIAATKRSLQLKKAIDGSGYFTITALAKEGEGRTSFPVLVQPVDSLAPAIPAGLKATIDSNGVVTLTWNKNTEKDLMGYKIFRAMKKEEEPVPLVDSVWYGTKFRDKLSLKLLNKKVYYAVTALDNRFNQSNLSALVEVKKPDIIPPSAAVITKYHVAGNQVTVNWINSPDEDIAAHVLYRKAATDSSYITLQRFAAKTRNSYTDTIQQGAGKYSYYIGAQSEGGLMTASEPLSVTISAAAVGSLQLTRLYAYPQPDKRRIEVVWDDQLKQVSAYQVYKSSGNGAMSLFQTLPAGQKGLYDTEVQPNTAYQYAVMAVLESGAYSEMKKVTVNY